MKKIALLVTIAAVVASCNTNKVKKDELANYEVFGDTITTANVISTKELAEKYKDLKVGDTVNVKFEGVVDEVCQKKGCWMTVDLGEDQTTFVRFKDYSFFVPFEAPTHNAVVEGKAFIAETSVEELQHYAKDAGKSEEEIAAITEPQRDLSFLANGVLIAK